VPEPPKPEAVAVTMDAGANVPAGASVPEAGAALAAEAGASGEAGTKPSRRRRGGRRKPPSGAEADEQAGDKLVDGSRVESAVQPADEALKDGEPEPAVDGAGAAGAAGGEGAGESAAPKRRRGSRGGRRSRARKARLAAAEHEALDRAAAEVAPEHGALLPEAELAEGAPPPLPAAGEQALTKTARKRGRRGGRRAAVEGAEVEAAGPAETEAARHLEAEAPRPDEAQAARRARGAKGDKPARGEKGEKPARGEKPGRVERVEGAKPAERPKRRERGRPKAIVRENAELAARPPSDRAAVGVTGAEPVEHKIILVSEQRNEIRVALVEDGHLAEMYFERPGKPSYLGDIYRAKVENVVPGMDAAFIDFGLEKNGFLYVDEVETEEGRRRGRRIADVLRPGQEITVQVMKDPMGSKGARLTTHLSLAGRYLVYVPGGSGVGVSRRLGQSERERLRDVSKQLKPRNAGLIVRTYAQGKGLEDLRRDMQYLSRLWSRLKKKAETVKAPGLVYGEADIALEVARDTLNETCERMLVDDEKRFKSIRAYLEKIAPELADRVELYTGAEPLFEAHGVEEQIARALERRVPLPSGGNLVIDHTEALTVIDVNSGRFTSGRSLEDTILRTNMEAAREVVRQLRLRDIGGIIVIDFIDMAHARNREAVLAKLEAELETDRTKSYVVELSPLGLVEMTRQNTTDGARGILTRTCQTCLGKGRVLSEESVALAVERRVRAHARKSNAKAVLVEVNRGVAERLEANGRLRQLEKETKRRVFLESSSTVPVDGVRILAEGSVAHVQGLRVPVSEGQEVDLELEFALTYSPRDAVGYVEGYMVIVEGGRPHLGEHRRVRITATARTGATAVLPGGSR
jgi:ribonuclease G